MRRLLVLVLAIAILPACGKPAQVPPPAIVGTPPAAAHVAAELAAPSVTVASAIAENPRKVPALVILDDRGLSVAVPPTAWGELAAFDASTAKLVARPGKVIHEAADYLGKALHEDVAMGRSSNDTIKGLGELREGKPAATDLDDPPPPPEEEADESGGTGTAMALDEGRMGKKDSDRAEGQYRMKRAGPAGESTNPAVTITGQIAEHGLLAPEQRALILATPTTKAAVLIDVLSQIAGLIGVRYQGAIRPLRLDFVNRDRGGTGDSVELRVGPTDLTFAAGTLHGPIDAAALKPAQLDATATVAVLVDPAVDAQRLIDVLVALDGIGVRTIGLGPIPHRHGR